MRVLLTGGTGFIGSHTAVELLNQNDEVIIIDNLSNSDQAVLKSIQAITQKTPLFFQGDMRDQAFLESIFSEYKIDAVIHFAGLKAVFESVQKPLLYYDNNVRGSLVLFEVMKKYAVRRIVFSSSATVYGLKNPSPLHETMPTKPINPYGKTKLHIEHILEDLYQAEEDWRIVILRYFNPIGAHPSGLIGENPKDIPNNLMPYILKVANRELPKLHVFGDDYNTKDGTGIRDYIHVVDLAQAHIKALDFIAQNSTLETINIGTSKGYSVLEVIKTFEKENQILIPYTIAKRRLGDVAECYADCSKAKKLLNWQATFDLPAMLRDAWRYGGTT